MVVEVSREKIEGRVEEVVVRTRGAWHEACIIGWDGEPRNIMMGAFAGHADIKQVVVVDEDVDVHDPQAVEWAVATRFQAGEDLVVVPGAQGSRLDPSARDGRVDKMGLDATRPLEAERFRFTVVHVPGEDDPEVERWLADG